MPVAWLDCIGANGPEAGPVTALPVSHALCNVLKTQKGSASERLSSGSAHLPLIRPGLRDNKCSEVATITSLHCIPGQQDGSSRRQMRKPRLRESVRSTTCPTLNTEKAQALFCHLLDVWLWIKLFIEPSIRFFSYKLLKRRCSKEHLSEDQIISKAWEGDCTLWCATQIGVTAQKHKASQLISMVMTPNS